MKQLGVNNLPKVVAQQRYGRGSNSRPLDRKSDALPLSHRAVMYYLHLLQVCFQASFNIFAVNIFNTTGTTCRTKQYGNI